MKLVICTKFQVNRMNCVESRRGGIRLTPPPSRLRVTIFYRRLLGLNITCNVLVYNIINMFLTRHFYKMVMCYFLLDSGYHTIKKFVIKEKKVLSFVSN